MEAYVDDIIKLRHYTSVSGEPTAADTAVMLTVFNDGEEIFQGEASVVNDTSTGNFKHYEITLSTHGLDAGMYNATWSYMIEGFDVEKHEILYVVRPYAGYLEFSNEYSGTDITVDEFRRNERIVRQVIESFCRQSFQFDKGLSYTLNGSDNDVLELPRRLVNLSDVRVMDSDSDFYLINEYVTVDEDERYRIRRKQWDAFSAGMNPISRRSLFKAGRIYRITGDWGWEFVPEPVKQAALLLINEYQCADARYREKFIQVIRAADWRMEFAVTGNETTGNANADTMLAGYRHFMWEVI